MSGTALLVWVVVAGAPELRTPVRGITISTHRGGSEWASDAIVVALEEIKALGANWVAIHPYARIGADGSVRYRDEENRPPEHILRPIREAKKLGLRILIKPHLAYWRSPFRWRGEIRFESVDDWARFWNDYERFILSVASWSQDADAFVVGTELRGTLEHDERWRSLIGKLRVTTSVPLTYAANWDDFREVTFWDALDVIGIQAYFPLTEGSDRSEEAIRHGWKRWMAELSAYSAEQGKLIAFTELGYNQSYDAPVRPWDDRVDDEGARSVQELSMRIALDEIEAEPAVIGAFLWKWFVPPRRAGRNFQLAVPEIERVIRARWLE
ncbi:MAG TPA: hypothetical protein VEK15_12670 [Vicinamibacteria bacterium]|nr:hypothetical protein [Vicinamibacteria bacterium]